MRLLLGPTTSYRCTKMLITNTRSNFLWQSSRWIYAGVNYGQIIALSVTISVTETCATYGFWLHVKIWRLPKRFCKAVLLWFVFYYVILRTYSTTRCMCDTQFFGKATIRFNSLAPARNRFVFYTRRCCFTSVTLPWVPYLVCKRILRHEHE